MTARRRYTVIWTDADGTARESHFTGKGAHFRAAALAVETGERVIVQEYRPRVVWEWADVGDAAAARYRRKYHAE